LVVDGNGRLIPDGENIYVRRIMSVEDPEILSRNSAHIGTAGSKVRFEIGGGRQ
jgi:hypothetical protein